MKCKICGGEILFVKGKGVCQSCGVEIALESIYENIEVYICYEENDTMGRRTKDSIIAQEIYRKLEENKISTFYERISASKIAGEDLSSNKLMAIQRAKMIIVVGSSSEMFRILEAKYSACFADKYVIPFCVDVDPGTIPKTLSKIQAMSYSTIGWDKDLIKGVYNILGREQDIDIGKLYKNRKIKLVVICVIVVVVTLVSLLFIKSTLGFRDINVDTPQNNTTSVPETKPLTQKETFDTANELLNQGSLVEALEYFLQTPEHPNSENMIKQIYSKYEGYYTNDNTVVHIEIIDNVRVELEIKITAENKVTRISKSALLTSNTSNFNYTDNNNESGVIDLVLENSGFTLKIDNNAANSTMDLFFRLSEKSDQPIVQISADMLLSWLEEEISLDEIVALGYELQDLTIMERAGANHLYRIKYTDIYLSILSYVPQYDIYGGETGGRLFGVSAPAELIAPTRIGSDCSSFYDEKWIYHPGYYISADVTFGLDSFSGLDVLVSENTDGKISSDTLVGVAKKKYYLESTY